MVDDAMTTEERIAQYIPSPAFIWMLKDGMREAQRHPERAQLVFDLIQSLPGQSEEEQRRTVERVQQLMGKGES